MLTLGINYSQMHDSAACIVRDGELLFCRGGRAHQPGEARCRLPEERYSGLSGFRRCASGAVGRSVFRLANGGAGVPARFEVFRHRENAAELSQRAEFDASLPEHVASRKWSEEVRAAIRSYESEDAVCRSSPGARYQRVCLLRV